MSPRTVLCDTCQHFRDGLHYNARQEEEAKELLKRFKEHLSKANQKEIIIIKIPNQQKNKENQLINIIQRVKHNIAVLIPLLIIVMFEPKMFMCHIQINK